MTRGIPTYRALGRVFLTQGPGSDPRVGNPTLGDGIPALAARFPAPGMGIPALGAGGSTPREQEIPPWGPTPGTPGMLGRPGVYLRPGV